jgi:hypothetical protein
MRGKPRAARAASDAEAHRSRCANGLSNGRHSRPGQRQSAASDALDEWRVIRSESVHATCTRLIASNPCYSESHTFARLSTYSMGQPTPSNFTPRSRSTSIATIRR